MVFNPQPKGNYRKKKKATRSAKVPESTIQKMAEIYLEARGLTYVRLPDSLYRTIFASQTIPLMIKKQISDCIKGLPDITVLHESGKYICFELKTETGKQSQAQRRFERGVGHDNYFVVRSFDEFRECLDKFLILYSNKEEQ